MESKEHDVSTVTTLKANLDCPIVQINYRLGREQQFPLPIHDVLAGYDWIQNHMLPKRAITRAGRSEHVGKVAVCGELIGGGLATALALTECRVGQPGIMAAAVNNPLVDWASVKESTSKTGKLYSKAPAKEADEIKLGVREILNLRKTVFKKPDQYFDPFASPILFFRSAGVEVPQPALNELLDDMEQLTMLEREQAHPGEHSTSDTPVGNCMRQDGSDDQAEESKRKASRRFPSKALGLRLPPFHISAGVSSPIREQANELTHMLRQSFARQSKYAASESNAFGRKVLLNEEKDEMDDDQQLVRKLQMAEAEKKATLNICNGVGLWDESAAGLQSIADVAMWLKDRLD